MLWELPDWCRIFLLVLSLVSFLPQLRVLLVRRDSSGISPFYVLFNLISATEQFTQCFAFVLIMAADQGPHNEDTVVHSPPSQGDWINLGHMAVVSVLWLVFFLLTLIFLPGHLDHRLALLSIYVAYLLISVVPEFVYAANTCNLAHDDPDKWVPSMFVGFHAIYVVPYTTVLCIAAVFLQARELVLSRSPAGSPSASLSTTGLRLQAVVFAFVAVLWLARLPYFAWWRERSIWDAMVKWYLTVAWFTVNDGIFAAGQAFLLWVLVGSHHRIRSIVASSREAEPLLGHRG